ncbi:hypothetical protein Bbelb_185680 [Branchiostoma belcheri]|nr:hypothetical protein Bbelb_185680 [Branchiostoma belcheri]
MSRSHRTQGSSSQPSVSQPSTSQPSRLPSRISSLMTGQLHGSRLARKVQTVMSKASTSGVKPNLSVARGLKKPAVLTSAVPSKEACCAEETSVGSSSKQATTTDVMAADPLEDFTDEAELVAVAEMWYNKRENRREREMLQQGSRLAPPTTTTPDPLPPAKTLPEALSQYPATMPSQSPAPSTSMGNRTTETKTYEEWKAELQGIRDMFVYIQRHPHHSSQLIANHHLIRTLASHKADLLRYDESFRQFREGSPTTSWATPHLQLYVDALHTAPFSTPAPAPKPKPTYNIPSGCSGQSRICCPLRDPRVENYVMDFEDGMWGAMRAVIPTCSRKGCAFHLTTAIYRKIQRIAYMEQEWLNNSVWSVEQWSVDFQPVRTNNDTEGYHTRLSKKAQHSLPLYLLVDLQHEESRYVSLQAKLVSMNRLMRFKRKPYREWLLMSTCQSQDRHTAHETPPTCRNGHTAHETPPTCRNGHTAHETPPPPDLQEWTHRT